ncbi:hypothetical protein Ddye_027398 [Dipteronia dyeriana]|uniref:Uncharacterized protein n=1 Tax=Dipteronia dyeriana TaxID=168575 RepID=A0AAD9WRC5_9ROSI|nr:hypothetical protein Ddye_027398 [Dipteronia dyeriana]
MILLTGFPLGLVMMEIVANGMMLSAATSQAMSLSCTSEILSAMITHPIKLIKGQEGVICGSVEHGGGDSGGAFKRSPCGKGSDMQPYGIEPVHGCDNFLGAAFEHVLQQDERAEAMPLWVP